MSERGNGSRESEDGDDKSATVESPAEEKEVEFEDEPIGASPEEVADSIDTAVGSGALAEVLSRYSPDQFNDLVGGLTDEYRASAKREFKFRLAAMVLSIVLVCGLFAGLLWFSINTGTNGGAVIFFAGSIAGYFMRLATDLA
ncbi:hypothetical protein [Halolamina rubra]|uniref:hypothetical protein n=1 Tax=Halolamina rubra TaxID=1380430 RepID=UPI0012AB70B3|nr:hypothetical protein [Halolamina rubra]